MNCDFCNPPRPARFAVLFPDGSHAARYCLPCFRESGGVFQGETLKLLRMREEEERLISRFGIA